MQLEANSMISHSPEVATRAAISPSVKGLAVCLSLSVKRSLAIEVCVSARVALENGNLKFCFKNC